MRALITGATGFLGGALAHRLRQLSWEVTGLGRNSERGAALTADGVRFVQADLADATAVRAACAGQDIVFHCGALSSPWGREIDFHRANVVGTENVLLGCQAGRVTRLIHVSTPAVYFNYQTRLGVREGDPLPPPVNAYARSKRQAEALVAAAHIAGLPVITLRPRAIFGPGDTAIFPRLLRAIEAGRLRRLGSDEVVTDLTYVDNVVAAMMACVDAPAACLGHTYNISNGEAIALWPLIDDLCRRLGYPPPRGRVPFPVAYSLAAGLELAARLTGGREPLLTRYSVGLLSTSLTLDISAAQRDLDYVPRITVAEGVDRFLAWWKEAQG